MSYDFATKREYVKFLSNLREGAVGDQSTIYFDDKSETVIKTFALTDYSVVWQKEKKLRELSKYKRYFPRAALPEEIIRCNGRCCGYTMPLIKGCESLKEFQFKARKHTIDRREILKVACNLARLVRDLHNEGIVIGDFHADQFMTKNGEVYVCDTDTWGITNRRNTFEADKVGIAEYIDPKSRDFSSKGVVVNQYTKETDYFALAVVVFEMMVGFNPFDGTYTLVNGYDKTLRALNGISIIGNHNLKKLDSFNMEHVAWMSKEMQSDFLKIFEGGKRFNILSSLEENSKHLEKCKKGHIYNSSRYSKCPICKSSAQGTLEEFRTYNSRNTSYERFSVFPSDEVRKVIDFSTYFDYDRNVVSVRNDGKTTETEISLKTEEIYFVGDEITVTVERLSKTKQFFYTILGKFDSLYGNCSFVEKMKKCSNVNNPACILEVHNKDDKKLYSSIILQQVSRLNVCGYHMFYVNSKNQLIKVSMTVHACTEKVVYANARPFIYEVNENGDYCVCSINGAGHLDIIINGKKVYQLIKRFPKIIRYDNLKGKWCIITKKGDSNGYETYVVNSKGEVFAEFELFSFGGLNLKNCIFYNGMLVFPDNKKVIFLKSGKTIVKSTVSQINIGIVSKESKISIEENKVDRGTYLFIQNSAQVYKIRMN